MSTYKAPDGIVNHPGVAECLDGPSQGFEDYRHDVFLHPGWSFQSGRMAGCRSGAFNNVKEFLAAQPRKVAA